MRTYLGFVVLLLCVVPAAVKAQADGYVVLAGIQNGPAEVLLDDLHVGTLGPSELTLTTRSGSHSLIVRKDGFADFVQRIEVRSGDITQVAATLVRRGVRVLVDVPNSGTAVSLTTVIRVLHLDPARVAIRVAGDSVGVTPATIEVPAGEVRLRVGQLDLCLRTVPYDTSLIRVRNGRLEELRNIWSCDSLDAPPRTPNAALYTGDRTTDLAAKTQRDRERRGIDSARSMLAAQRELEQSFVMIDSTLFGQCAVDSFGRAYCKGRLPTTEDDRVEAFSDHYVSLQFLLGRTAKQISVSLSTGCILTTLGVPVCWGLNSEYDAHGPGAALGEVLTPEPLDTVIVGRIFACGLTGSHRLVCWGSNSYVFDAQPKPTNSAVLMSSSMRFLQVTATSDAVCALSDQWKVYCLGLNRDGMLGRRLFLSDRSSSLEPIAYSGNLRSFVHNFGEFNRFCASDLDYASVCWGRGIGSTPRRLRAGEQ